MPKPKLVIVSYSSTSSLSPESHSDDDVRLYMPPAKHRLLQALKKSINDRCNKVNTSNLPIIIREIFQDNIVRGRGLLARAIIQSQIASPFNTSVYVALVSVINSKFSQIGELIIKRLISSFCRTYVHHDQKNCLATTKYLAHLVNQNILHEIVVLEILGLLLEKPYLSDDKVELDSVFSTLRALLHESSLDQRTQSMIEVLFAIRKDQFKAYPSILTGLVLVDENYQYTHMIPLDDQCEPEPMLDVFSFDEQYEKNERKYKQIRKTILDESSDGEYESSRNCSSSDDEDDQKK